MQSWACPAVAALVAVAAVNLPSPVADAQPRRCKGMKQWYAGECRYSEDVEKLEQAGAAERARQAAERQRQQEAEAQGQAVAADVAACSHARDVDSIEVWRKYAEERPSGTCRAQADARIAELQSAAQPAPAPPAPRESGAEAEPDSTSLSPLVYVGLGLAGAGLVTFGVAGGIALSRSAELQDVCHGDACPHDSQADIDSARMAAHAATAGGVVAGIGSALFVVGLLTSGSAEPETRTGSLRLSMGVGGAALGGRF